MTQQDRRNIAPMWHTLGVLALLASVAMFAFVVKLGSSAPRLGHVASFVLITVSEWAVFTFSIWRSAPNFHVYLQHGIGDRNSVIKDIFFALLLCAVTLLAASLVTHLLGKTGWDSLQGMRPHSGAELALWIVMAISAGVCEETVYRGYLQQQFSAWTRSTSLGVVLQAAVFGLSHAYQGVKYVLLIVAIGCIYGVAAAMRKGLRANMIAHACLDIAAAF